jgi:hypothetical protein
MTGSIEKMNDERSERRTGSEELEAGFGEDSEVAHGVIFKMDVRYGRILFSSNIVKLTVL